MFLVPFSFLGALPAGGVLPSCGGGAELLQDQEGGQAEEKEDEDGPPVHEEPR